MGMSRAEFDAIKNRAAAAAHMPSAAQAVIICQRGGRPIHPDELGKESSAAFKRYCEALAMAVRDRDALVKMIEEDFDTSDYFPQDAGSEDQKRGPG